jgi:hypothetical protein
MAKLLSVKELQAKIAQAEADKASVALRHQQAEEAEKKALLDRLNKPSGLTDDEVAEKASIIINRAVENGLMAVQVFVFPTIYAPTTGGPLTRPSQVGRAR